MDYLEFESGKLKVRSVMGFLNANELVESLYLDFILLV